MFEPNIDTEMDGKAFEPEPIVEEMAMKVPLPERKPKRRRLKKMTIKKSLKKKKKVEKAFEPKELEKATIEGEDRNHNSDDSLELTKIIDTVVHDIRNAPGSPPRPNLQSSNLLQNKKILHLIGRKMKK